MRKYLLLFLLLPSLFLTAQKEKQSVSDGVFYNAEALKNQISKSEIKSSDKYPTGFESAPIFMKLYGTDGPYSFANQKAEILDLRDASSKHYQNTDGKITSVLSAGEVHYLENGLWKTILNDFHTVTKTGFQYGSEYNSFKTYMGNTLQEGLEVNYPDGRKLNIMQGVYMVSLDANKNEISNTRVNFSGNIAQVKDEFLVYANVSNGINAIVENNSIGYKVDYEVASLNNLPALTSNTEYIAFVEKIHFDNDKYTYYLDNGKVVFQNSKKEFALEYHKPVVYPKIYKNVTSLNLTEEYIVKKSGNDFYIYILMKKSWLQDPDFIFPIVVDPTVTLIPNNAVAWTYTVQEDGDCEQDDNLKVGFFDGTFGNEYYQCYSKFNTTSIPDANCIQTAYVNYYQYAFENDQNDDNALEFYFQALDPFGTDPVATSCAADDVNIDATGTVYRRYNVFGNCGGTCTDYNETNNQWKNFPDNVGARVQLGLVQNFIAFSLDNIETGHSDPTLGCGFLGLGVCDNDDYLQFRGHSNSNRPTLVVTHEAPSVAPTSISVTPSATICSGTSVTLTQVGGTLGGGASWNWYSGSCGGTLVGTGNSITVTPAANTTYYVRAQGICNTTACASLAIVVNTASTAPTSISGTSTICAGGTTTLSIVGGSLGSGATYQWFSGSCGGTSVGSGTSITISPSVTTTYYVRAQGLCFTTSCVSQTVTVQTASVAPGSITSTLSTLCAGTSTTLSVNGGSLGTGATWNWYSGTCGGTLVGTGSSITVSPTSNTTYFVRAQGPCNTTTCASTGIVVNNLSVAPTGITSTGDTVCIGGSTILSVAGGSLGTGATWQWYTNSCGGVSVGSGNSISVSPTSTTIYYVRAEGTCNTTVCAQRSITAAQNPVQPICPDVLQCESFPVTLTATGNGGTIKWYMTNISTPELSTGNSLSLGMFGAGTYYRYVTETNAFGCESTRNEVEIVIKPIPSDAPAAADATICPGASASLLATNPGGAIIPATNFNWYNSPALTTVVYTGAIYNTPNLITPPATYTFYVAGVLDGCIGDTSSVVVDFYQAAKPIASNDTSVCNGDMVSLFASAAGSVEIRWYANGDLSGYIQSGASFTTPSLNSNTTYYVTAVYPNGCQSQAEPVVISINPLALSPVLTDEEYCQGDDVVLNANNINGIITWYSDAALTTAVGTGSPLNLGVLPADTLTFFAQVNNGTCVSLVIANTVEIEALPVAPTLTAPTICAGEQATITVSSPFNVSWYADVAMTNLLFVGSTFTTPTLNVSTTYYVSNTNVNGCQSLSSSVLVTVNPKPAAPVVADEFVCANESATLIATGGSGTFIWFSDAALANQLFVGATFVTPNLTTNTTYYVVLDNGLCRSVAKTVLVSINPAAISPITTDEQYCETEDLILNASNVNGTITWYSDAALTNVVGTGTPLNLGSLFTAGTYNFFAQVDNGTCVSLVVANSVEIIALPPAPILTAPTICAGEQAVINVTNALNVNWYSDAAMTNLLFVGATFTTPILNANTTYYVSNSNAGGCQSLSVSVLVTVNPKPAAPTAANVVICKNQSATLIASGGAGIFTWYSDAALANQLFVGATFVTPNLNANTSYYVVLNNGLCQSLAKQVNVTVNLDIVIVIDSITDVLCNGSNTGAIYTSVSGGNGIYNYAWTGGSTSQDLVNAAAGNYVLTVTDGLGCTASNNASISSPDELTAAIDNIQNVSCNGFSDGSVEVTISGGTSAYTYSWSDGSTLVSTSKNLYGIGAGSYTLTITDANGCVQSLVANVTENGALTASINSTNVLCYGGSGTASVVATGGNGTYTYLWSNFANTASVSGLDMGAVSVIVYDGIGCSVHVYDTIRGPIAPLTITTLGTKDVTCFNGNDGFINTSVSGGTAPYVLFWSPTGETTSNIANLSAGQYILTVRDANLCVITKTFEINNALEIVSTMSVTNPACYGLETGMIVVGNSGGTAPYSYAWNTTPAQTGVIAINLPGDTSYTVTITDINGCTGQNTASVVYPAEMLVTTIPTNVSCISSANGSVTVDVQNGNAPLQYELNGFLQSNNVFDNLNGGNYVVFVKDNNNCVASASFNISTVSGLQAVLEGAGNDLNFVTENLYIVRGEEVSLNVSLLNDNGNPILGYNWNPNYIDSTSLLSNPSFYPNDNLMVIVEVLEDINGNVCSVFDTLRIDVSQEMKAFVPTAFSPNNNGQNNFFELNVLGSQNLDVKIFNRWGQLIFANANQGNGPNNINDVSLTDGTNPRGAWDGKYNGEDVPTGAYAYVVEVTYFDGHKEVLSGSVTIIR